MLKNLTERGKAWLYAFFSQVVWGTGGVAIKLVDFALPSSLLVSIRHGIGALVLGTSILNGKLHVLKGVPWLHLIMFGILAAGLPDLLLVESIRKAGAIIPIMLARIEIPLAVILAHIFLKERVGALAYIAGALSLVGAWLISFRPEVPVDFSNEFYIGVLLALGAAVLWALSTIYAKFILTRKTDPLALGFVRQAVGSIFNLAIVIILIQNPLSILGKLTPIDWVLLIYLGVFLSGLAYLAFYRSLKVLDAHVASILLSVSLGVALFLGLAIGESVVLTQWLGIGLVVVSIVLIQKNSASGKSVRN